MPRSPYSHSKHQHLQPFLPSIEGSEDALFCVVSTCELSAEAHQALQASAQRLGYDLRQCAYIVLNKQSSKLTEEHNNIAANTQTRHTATEQPNSNNNTTAVRNTLTPHDLLTIIEAIDPLCVVLADHESTKAASAGYNVALSLEAKERLLGRGCCCFENFEDLLTTPEGKQKAWACLKTLPHNE